MTVPLEQEVKLKFDTHEAASQAVRSAGGRLVVSRRLLDDQLYDTPDGFLRRVGRALRIRRDGAGVTYLTYKGQAIKSTVKAREERETSLGDPDVAHAILTGLGFQPIFRGQKYREEFAVGATRVAIDETPMGTFVEVEGAPPDIEEAANRLGRSRHDYILESYPSLYRQWCLTHHLPDGDMMFDDPRRVESKK